MYLCMYVRIIILILCVSVCTYACNFLVAIILWCDTIGYPTIAMQGRHCHEALTDWANTNISANIDSLGERKLQERKDDRSLPSTLLWYSQSKVHLYLTVISLTCVDVSRSLEIAPTKLDLHRASLWQYYCWKWPNKVPIELLSLNILWLITILIWCKNAMATDGIKQFPQDVCTWPIQHN